MHPTASRTGRRQDQAIILAQNDLNKPTACAGCNGRPLASLIQDFKGIFTFKTRDEVGWPRSLAKSSYTNFEPRLGFAWRMFGSNSTVLRAGYGRFYEVVAGNVMWNYTTNPPLSRNLAFSGDPNAIPTLTLQRPFPGSGVQGAPGLSGGILYDWKDPYQDNWNVAIQRGWPHTPRWMWRMSVPAVSASGSASISIRRPSAPGTSRSGARIPSTAA